MRATGKSLISKVPGVLAGLFDLPEDEVKIQARPAPELDLLVHAAGYTFAVNVLGAASPGALTSHAAQVVAAARRLRRKVLPLLAVPFMSDTGRRVCADAQVAWFDLSGNAHIIGPRLRVIVEGRPNRFLRPGRPASIFAPKSARVIRWLLENQGQALVQRDIARATDMTEGFVSRIASRLERERYVVREPSGALRVKDPQLLLDAWRDEYHFDKHTIIKGVLAARSGDALTRFVGDTLTEASAEHAATGLAAAWQMTHFAGFRIATFFVAEPCTKDLMDRLGFREEARGANLWLVNPNDAGVFHGAGVRDAVRCVHPVQAYVYLKSHPERAPEAAERLQRELLAWKHDG